MPLAPRSPTLILLLSALALAVCQSAKAAEPLPSALVIEVGSSNSDQLAVVAVLMREAYKRIGVELRLRELPMRRRLLLADNGGLDGDLARVAGVQQEAPQLLRVNVPVYQFSLKAYDESVRQLQRGKIEYALAPALAFEGALRRAGVNSYCAMSTDTEPHALFHMLNRRHAALVPKLEQVLAQMQQSGEMATIVASAEKQLAQPRYADR
jgi:polar amino acid transport system substrate-binding protein